MLLKQKTINQHIFLILHFALKKLYSPNRVWLMAYEIVIDDLKLEVLGATQLLSCHRYKFLNLNLDFFL